MTSKVTNAIELVKNSPASFFTKEDVIKLLNDVSDVPAGDEDSPNFSEEKLDELIEQVREDIVLTINESELIDYDSAEFKLIDNRIELEDIDIDTSHIQDLVEDAIRNWFDNNIL
jgi:hypothetical protein